MVAMDLANVMFAVKPHLADSEVSDPRLLRLVPRGGYDLSRLVLLVGSDMIKALFQRAKGSIQVYPKATPYGVLVGINLNVPTTDGFISHQLYYPVERLSTRGNLLGIASCETVIYHVLCVSELSIFTCPMNISPQDRQALTDLVLAALRENRNNPDFNVDKAVEFAYEGHLPWDWLPDDTQQILVMDYPE